MNNIEKKAISYIDNHKKELFDMLSKLISYDTQNYSTHGNEINCIGYIKEQYDKLGLETEVYFPDDVAGMTEHEDYMPGRGTDKRPNISGVYHGKTGTKRIMLAAHTDTMPIADESLWSVPPLGGIQKDDRIYGRGSGDNKFGIATSIMALKAIQKIGVELNEDVVLTSYCDEEYGGGNGALSSCLKYPCDTYVNLDGGNLELWVCSMGGCVMTVSVESEAEQDSAEAVIDALEIIRKEIIDFGNVRRKELSEDEYFKGSDMERSALRILEYKAGEEGCNLGQGYFDFVFYTNKTEQDIFNELDEIKSKIERKLSKMQMKFGGFTKKSRFFHCLTTNQPDNAVNCMQNAAEEITGTEIKKTGACLSDLSLFLKYGGSSSFNFGILRDFKLYGGAHQPDEYVECQQFIDITKSIVLFLLRYGN